MDFDNVQRSTPLHRDSIKNGSVRGLGNDTAREVWRTPLRRPTPRRCPCTEQHKTLRGTHLDGGVNSSFSLGLGYALWRRCIEGIRPTDSSRDGGDVWSVSLPTLRISEFAHSGRFFLAFCKKSLERSGRLSRGALQDFSSCSILGDLRSELVSRCLSSICVSTGHVVLAASAHPAPGLYTLVVRRPDCEARQ